MLLLPLVVVLLAVPALGQDEEEEGGYRDPLLHLATENQIVIRDRSGGYKMAYKSHDGFRAEVRDANGVVKGVYSLPGENGEPLINPYISDKEGYHTARLADLRLQLPPLPFYLHPQGGHPKFPKDSSESRTSDLSGSKQDKTKYRTNIVLHPFGRLDEKAEAVVLEPISEDETGASLLLQRLSTKDYEDVVLVGEDDEEEQEVPFGALAGIPGSQIDKDGDEAIDIEEASQQPPTSSPPSSPPSQSVGIQVSGTGIQPIVVLPGQPIAQIKPSATAIAGEGGMAQAAPGGSAVVGPGGVAVSTPTSTALVGPGGVAISAPFSSSQAGVGGIAIAGGHAIAVAGIENPEKILGQQYEPGFLILKQGSSDQKGQILIQTGNQPAVIPIVANYFYNAPPHSGLVQDGGNHVDQENGAKFSPYFNPTLSSKIQFSLS